MPNYNPKPIPIKYGAEHHRWKGGRYIGYGGYVYVKVQTGVYKREHRLVMERHLGRILLKGELVHHKNDDRQDNRIENLELKTHATHCQLHNPGDKEPIGVILCPECKRYRPHGGHGLCNSCYTKWWARQNPEWNRRLSRERQKRYRQRHREYDMNPAK